MSAFIICSGLCACKDVMNGCAVCEFGSAVNRVQVVLSGFSVRLFCFVQTKTWYFLAALVLVCVDVMVMSSA